jgi:hypothetical protein
MDRRGCQDFRAWKVILVSKGAKVLVDHQDPLVEEAPKELPDKRGKGARMELQVFVEIPEISVSGGEWVFLGIVGTWDRLDMWYIRTCTHTICVGVMNFYRHH